MLRLALICGLTIVLTGCISTRDRHGFVLERGEGQLEALTGVDTKDSVLARYGEPSVRSPLTDDTWYYISAQTNTRAFYRTQTLRRQIVAFSFDDTGTVDEVINYGLEDGAEIAMVDRITRTRGRELSFIEQLLGGIGQAPGALDPDGGGPGGPGGPGGRR